ncbi:MAG: DNA-processing protein DprA [Candidatus Paceibacterota bacterium]
MKLKEVEILHQDSPGFPSLLKEIPSAPTELYVLGNLPDEQLPKIAIVGTRKATSSGCLIAKQLAQTLSRIGAIIVSGLAMGIDTAAHEGAVAAKGQTIAVLGNGLNEIYPHQNENLAKKILEFKGAIISEYPPETPSFPAQFLERNRIVSGLSIATIVVEAPERSGALVTARLAAEQGREVFVVPGPVNHPNYKGSHQLIRDGARLVASVEDVLEDLGLATKYESNTNIRNYENNKKQIKDENQLIIYKAIQEAGAALDIDKIIKLTKLEPQIVNQSIALLIINNIIRETEGGYTL